MTTLVTQPMVVDQEVKVMDLVETKVDPVGPKAVVDEIAAQEVELEVVVPRSEEHMLTLYQTQKSHSPVTFAEPITKLALGLNIILGIRTKTKMEILLLLKMWLEFQMKVKEHLVVPEALVASVAPMKETTLVQV